MDDIAKDIANIQSRQTPTGEWEWLFRGKWISDDEMSAIEDAEDERRWAEEEKEMEKVDALGDLGELLREPMQSDPEFRKKVWEWVAQNSPDPNKQNEQ